MGYVIVVAGKGGTGKTTISALITRIISERKLGSVLAVDADPNSNLGEVLGRQVKKSIGTILDEIASAPQAVPAGMSKDRFLEFQVQTTIAEGEGFDLLTMGRPEGPGCYCYVNNCLRGLMAKLIKDYDYIVVDNEAGLEHLSRRTTRSADALVVVSDATPVGLKAARRIKSLVDELQIEAKKKLLLINRNQQALEKNRIAETGLELIGNIPVDEELLQSSLKGSSLMDLKNTALSISALSKIGDLIWQRS